MVRKYELHHGISVYVGQSLLISPPPPPFQEPRSVVPFAARPPPPLPGPRSVFCGPGFPSASTRGSMYALLLPPDIDGSFLGNPSLRRRLSCCAYVHVECAGRCLDDLTCRHCVCLCVLLYYCACCVFHCYVIACVLLFMLR